MLVSVKPICAHENFKLLYSWNKYTIQLLKCLIVAIKTIKGSSQNKKSGLK